MKSCSVLSILPNFKTVNAPLLRHCPMAPINRSQFRGRANLEAQGASNAEVPLALGVF